MSTDFPQAATSRDHASVNVNVPPTANASLTPVPVGNAVLRYLAVFTVALVVHGLLQATIFRADIPLADSWFHARYSWLLATGRRRIPLR